MNATAVREEWLPIVQQCEAQNGSIYGLPSLADVFGRGVWHPVASEARKNGTCYIGLYWYVGTKATGRISHRVGSFYLPVDTVQRGLTRQNKQVGDLTVGWDNGRRLMKISSGKNTGVNPAASA